MQTHTSRQFMIAAAMAVIIAGTSCQKDQLKTSSATPDETALTDMVSENGNNPDDRMLSDAGARTVTEPGYVYTESNDAAQNGILMYRQATDGKLSLMGTTASGGKGNSAGLGSQGAVVMNDDHKLLFAVNAGDNTISSFYVHSDGTLSLAHTIGSYGTTPISVTMWQNLLYVVNSGSDNIYGYAVGSDGSMSPIEGSWQALSSKGSGPAEIKFHPDGKVLFVTEKNNNKIGSFPISSGGAAEAGTFMPSVGATPFGFEFAKGKNFMIVSNAAGGGVDAGSCTSYSTSSFGILNDVNGAVADHESAPCWVAPTYYGRYAYVTNTAGNTISAYYISPVGKLYLLPFATIDAGAAPIDIVVSSNNRCVYSLNSMSYTISEYKRGLLGTLTLLEEMPNLPPYAAGLACY